MKYILTAAAIGAAIVSASPVSALTLLAAGAGSSPVTFSDPTEHALLLSGAPTLSFKTTKDNQRIIVQAFVMCQVTPSSGQAAESPYFIHIDNTADPTGPTIACGTSAGAVPLASTGTFNYVTVIPAIGTHTISLFVTNNGASTTFYKWSLLVER